MTITDKLRMFPTLEDALANCPERDTHDPDMPRCYFEFFAYAERMTKTHRQKRCGGCGRYLVLVPK